MSAKFIFPILSNEDKKLEVFRLPCESSCLNETVKKIEKQSHFYGWAVDPYTNEIKIMINKEDHQKWLEKLKQMLKGTTI
jgi:hypothetical protein